MRYWMKIASTTYAWSKETDSISDVRNLKKNYGHEKYIHSEVFDSEIGDFIWRKHALDFKPEIDRIPSIWSYDQEVK